MRISAIDKPPLPQSTPADSHPATLCQKFKGGQIKQGKSLARVIAGKAAFPYHRRRRCHRNAFALLCKKECVHLLGGLVVGASRRVGGVLGLGLGLGRCGGGLVRRLGLGGSPESLRTVLATIRECRRGNSARPTRLSRRSCMMRVESL